MKPTYLILDFDSTLIRLEGLNELAKIALAKKPNRERTLARIREITTRGMEGEISIEESLTQRLKLLDAHKRHIPTLIKLLKKNITPSFERNKDFLKKNADHIYVLTSGFKEYVVPVIKSLGLKENRVFANSFSFNKQGKITGYKENSLVSQDRGKLLQLEALKLKGDVYVIGDGHTDMQLKESARVKLVYGFVENVQHQAVLDQADKIIRSFDEYLYLNKLPTLTSYPKSKIHILLLESIHERAVEALRKEGFQVDALSDALDEQELSKRIAQASFLGIRSKTRVTKEALKHAKRLLSIGAFCIGTEQIDLEACSLRGVAVFNAPFSNTRSVVELAFGEIIMLMRRVFETSTLLHQGKWQKTASGSHEVRGKKLGIVGYGNIGSQLSVLAETFGMEVYYYDVVEKLTLGNAKKCKSLEDLLSLVDIVTVHVDGRSANKNLFGKKQFELMKKGALFLNLSRGGVVEITALVEALRTQKICGAAVDVYPHEPSSNKEEFISELRGLPNVILTPHIGGSTLEAQENIAEYVANRFLDYLNSGSSFMSVNFPNIQLPTLQHAHRLLHIHHNVPGILAEINGILAENRINILGQYLKTNEQIGYVITDVNKRYNRQVIHQLESIPHTVKFRVLY